RSVARAQTRAVEAGLRNVRFVQSDVNQISTDQLFDAAVGRLILELVPGPVAVLRLVSRLVRPGGIIAFHEVSPAPALELSAHLALWSASASLIAQTLQLAGANIEMGIALYRIFQEAGLPAPRMSMEILLGSDPDFTQWIYDVLCSLRPQIQQLNLSLAGL